jgi:hypothetical protein
MARSFGFAVLHCTQCGGRFRLIALIEDSRVIRRMLGHLGLALAGGKTTISNFVNQMADTDLRTTLVEASDLVKRQAIADVILHVTDTDPNGVTPADVAMLADHGFTLKIFWSVPPSTRTRLPT